jgi:hypothetical protein
MISGGDGAQKMGRDCLALPMLPQKAGNAPWMLKGLNGSATENTIKTAIAKANVIPMVTDKSVHGEPPRGLVMRSHE